MPGPPPPSAHAKPSPHLTSPHLTSPHRWCVFMPIVRPLGDVPVLWCADTVAWGAPPRVFSSGLCIGVLQRYLDGRQTDAWPSPYLGLRCQAGSHIARTRPMATHVRSGRRPFGGSAGANHYRAYHTRQWDPQSPGAVQSCARAHQPHKGGTAFLYSAGRAGSCVMSLFPMSRRFHNLLLPSADWRRISARFRVLCERLGFDVLVLTFAWSTCCNRRTPPSP